MTTEELASAIILDVEAGLVGLHNNPTISLEQIEDEVVATRELVILE